jgi:hypothetical protein
MIANGFYYFAFLIDEGMKWGSTPFKEEIIDITYHKALNCMINTNQHGEMDRRQLLYAYLKPYWTPDATANRETKPSHIDTLMPSLPSDNSYILRALKNLCIAYNRPPKREIIGSNDKKLKGILDDINYNGFMQKLYRNLKLTNKLLVRSYISMVDGEKEIRLKYWGAEDYRTLKNEQGEIIEVWIITKVAAPFRDVVKYDYRFWVWTTKELKQVDIDGKPQVFTIDGKQYTSIPNPYGFIPYLEVSLTNNDDDYNETDGGKWELVRGQIECNSFDINITEMTTYLSFPIRAAYNFHYKNKDEVDMSPRSIILLEQQDIDDQPPDIIESGSDTSFSILEDLKDKKIKNILKNMGLPLSIIDDTVTLPESGIAINEMRKELIETRQEDISNLKRIDSKIIKLLAKTLDKDPASEYKGLFSGQYAINVDYQELETPSLFVDQQAKIDYMEENCFISPLEKYISLTGDESITDEAELIKMVQENKDSFDKLKGITGGTEINSIDAGTNLGNAGEKPASGAGTTTQEPISPIKSNQIIGSGNTGNENINQQIDKQKG